MWWLCKLWTFVYFIQFLSFVQSFNVDSNNYAIYTGPSDYSMFGFSLTLHKENGQGWLIVGAPEAQSTYPPGVYRGGAVYKCPVDRDDSCQEIIFDTQDQRYNPENRPWDNRTEQWFGATVTGTGAENGPIVACAPRYSWYPTRMARDPVGTCWVSDGHFNEINEFSPCRTFKWGYHRQGSCQAGFSAAITTNGDRLFVGAPGSWWWQGEIYSIDAHAKFKFKPDTFSGAYGSEDSLERKSSSNRPVVISTPKNMAMNNSYMGYSTVIGNFVGENNEQGIAIGLPRENDLKGTVIIATWNVNDILYEFSSDQLGSYYGYALAASDVDGDGKDDLIIGAPMYTPQNSEGKYDVGRVYVIYQNNINGRFVQTHIIDGFNTKSRFGQALSTLGDINQDGYQDFAIGAPYDGTNQRGAVYIYHGSSKGIREKYSQVIFAEDVRAPSGFLNTFGFSLTGGIDLDGNQYPDMAVGAYNSNQAFYFRSRPVVIVDAQTRFRTPGKEIDLRNSDYKLTRGGSASITTIDFCIKYHGKGIPQYIDLDLQYILDSQNLKLPRMGFVDNEFTNILNDTIRLAKDSPENCVTKQVFIKSNIKDKLTPLEAEVKYFMRDEQRSPYVYRDPRSPLKPVLDLNSPPSRKDSISIHKDCGSDNICTPELSLSVKSNVKQYILGSQDKLTFTVDVANTGEDSFETILEIKYPESIYYLRKEERFESQVLCNTYENNSLRCDLGNPIPKNRGVQFTIFWQPGIKEGMAPSYEFDIILNSTKKEQRRTHVSVAIWSNSSVEVTGKSHPDEVYFNSTQYTEDISVMYQNIVPYEKRLNEKVLGPQVTHVYYLKNTGPRAIKETEVFFIWPAATVSGEDFVYLLEAPYFSPGGNVQCDSESIVANRLNFNIDQFHKTIWERLGVEVSESGTTAHRIGTQYQTSSTNFDGRTKFGTTSSGASNRQSGAFTSTQFGSTSSGSTQYGAGNRQIGTSSTQYGASGSSTQYQGGNRQYEATGSQTGSRQYGVANTQTGSRQYGAANTQTGSRQYGAANTQTGSRQYGAANTQTGSRQYGVGSTQFGAGSTQYGAGSTQYGASGTQYGAGSTQYAAGSTQYGAGSTQYGAGSTQFGAESTEYGAGRTQYGASGTQYGADSRQQGSRQGGGETITYTKPGSTITKTSTKYYTTQDGVTKVSERNKTEVTNQTGTFVKYEDTPTTAHQHNLQTAGIDHYQNTTRDQNVYGQEARGYYGGSGGYQRGTTDNGATNQTQYSGSGYNQASFGRGEEEQRRAYGKIHYQTGSEVQGASTHQQGGSSYQHGAATHQQGGSTYQHGAATHQQGGSTYQHGAATDQSGSKVNEEEAEYDDEEEYEDEDEKEEDTGGHSISGYYDREGNYIERGQQEGSSIRHDVAQTQTGLEGAALGTNYGVTTLDLGKLGGEGVRQPVHEVFHKQHVAELGGEGRTGSTFSADGYRTGQSGSASSSTGSSSYGREGTYATASRGSPTGRRTEWKQETHWSQTGQIPPTYINTVERDNVPTDKPEHNQRFYGRKKRQVHDDVYRKIAEMFPCKSVGCIYMRCVVGSLESEETIKIALRSRINARVLRNITTSEGTNFSSIMVARISKIPYIGQSIDSRLYTHEITTTVLPQEPDLKPDIVPLWVVILSAVAGTLILLLLVFLLYKLGFFKRNRPSRSGAAERQPLNRNGYHRDEAL